MQTNNNINASEANLHAIDYWQVVKNRYGMIILTFLLVLLTAAVITYVMPKMYESKVVVEINPFGAKTEALGVGDNNRIMMTRQFLQTQFAIIESDETFKRVNEQLKLSRRWGMSEKDTLRVLSGIVNTRQERGTDLIEISVRHGKREDVKLIANQVANSYGQRRTDGLDKRRLESINEFKDKRRVQEDKVEDHRTRLYALSKKLQIPYHGKDGRFYAGRDSDAAESDRANQAYEEAKRTKDQLESFVNSLNGLSDEDMMVTLIASGRPEAAVLKTDYEQLSALKQNKSVALASGLGANHRTIKSLGVSIQEIEERLSRSVVNVRKKLAEDLVVFNQNVEKLRIDTDKEVGDLMVGAEEKTRFGKVREDYERELAILDAIKQAEFSELLGENLERDPLVFHQNATTPEVEEYVSPNWTLNMALGAVAGLIFGVGIAFALEFMDTSVKSLEDVERYLQVPVLAVVPRDVGVLHKQAGASPDAEAYRILRTNIEFNRKNPDDNAITVVSGGAGEGKSTTLVNLSYICAQGGYSTLMIDADLRRPRLHTFFDINNTVGLTNYLTTDLMLEDVILQTPVDNLFFMPSGILPADAAGILNSRRMSEMVQDVKQRFDLVLIDSPPILGVSDASVLASEVDLTMIVVQHRKLPRNMLMRVKQAVENVGGTVLGVVLNNVDVRSDSQYQYYTSYYTYYAPSEIDRDKTSANAVEMPERIEKKSSDTTAANDDDLY
ncbi:MAG: polysaccharide biosynthesis tyrosine autokinase [Akkermansiaceae bacterium]